MIIACAEFEWNTQGLCAVDQLPTHPFASLGVSPVNENLVGAPVLQLMVPSPVHIP
jgi:hypothetical protein